MEEIVPEPDDVRVGGRVAVIETVPVKLSTRMVPVTVAELEGVLVPLLEALEVGDTVWLRVWTTVPETVEVIIGLRLGTRTVPEIVVEEDEVLLALIDCVLFPELVELRVIAAVLV